MIRRRCGHCCADCDAVFGVTNYWEHGEKEFTQGCNLVDAIHHSNVQHTILSTLPHTRLLSGGRLAVSHFDSKARDRGVREGTESSRDLSACRFLLRELSQLLSRRDARRMAPICSVFHRERCRWPPCQPPTSAAWSLRSSAESFWYRDKQIGAVGRRSATDEYAEIMALALNRKIEYRYIDHATFASMPFPAARGSRQYVRVQSALRSQSPRRPDEVARALSGDPQLRSLVALEYGGHGAGARLDLRIRSSNFGRTENSRL